MATSLDGSCKESQSSERPQQFSTKRYAATDLFVLLVNYVRGTVAENCSRTRWAQLLRYSDSKCRRMDAFRVYTDAL